MGWESCESVAGVILLSSFRLRVDGGVLVTSVTAPPYDEAASLFTVCSGDSKGVKELEDNVSVGAEETRVLERVCHQATSR